MTDERIRIERDELFAPAVEQALARERAGRERVVADTPPVSPIRRLLLNPLFHLPTAAAIAALVAWLWLDPKIMDIPIVGGEVLLINNEPFDVRNGVISVTVGSQEVYVDVDRIKLEPGTHGEAAFENADAIKVGDHIEAAGLPQQRRLIAAAIRPTSRTDAYGDVDKPVWPLLLLFPLTATLIAFGLLFVDGLTTRNWIRTIERSLLGTLLGLVFSVLAFIPAGMCFFIAQHLLESEIAKHPEAIVVTVKDVSGLSFLAFAACRSAGWACIGCALGLGMNLVRSTKTQLRNSVIGGALGGALGGLFFDPIDRFVGSTMFAQSSTSRLVGLLAVGLSIGFFVALVERLGRDAWLRVRTGPLAGKSFILYKVKTVIGNSPRSDVYLYKDAEIDPSHAAIHRVGTTFEIEDMGSRMGTHVGGNTIRRRRLASGDQIVVGNTIMDFEERQKRTPAA
jgi:hypothetical protein